MTGHPLLTPEDSRRGLVVDAHTRWRGAELSVERLTFRPGRRGGGIGAASPAPLPGPAAPLKVLYGDDEHSMILRAAEIAALRPSSYVAAAALAMVEQAHSDRHPAQADEPDGRHRRRHDALIPHHDRELLAELVQARLALRRYAVNVNQIAAALNSSGAVHTAVMAHNLGRAVGQLAGPDLSTATVETLRRKVFTLPGRLVHSGRRLRLPEYWPWAEAITTAPTRITAIPLRC